MGLGMGVFEACWGEMRVYLGGGKAGMTEHFLNAAQVGIAVK